MNRSSGSIIRTGGGTDLAFAVVVLASYLSIFSNIREITSLELALMIGLGMTYLTLGIYGYGVVARLDWLPASLAYFFIQLALGGTIIYLGEGTGLNAMVLLPLAGHAVVLLPQRWTYVTNLLIILTYIGAVYLFSRSWTVVQDGFLIFIAGLVFIVVFTQMAVGEEKARGEAERLYKELREANQRLREYVSKVEELAISKERNRLAREIHDGLGHYLTTIFMQIQAGRAIMERDMAKAAELYEKAQNQTQEALLDVRRSVAALRDDPDEGKPLEEQIPHALQSLEVVGVKTEFIQLGVPRELSPLAHLTLYRAVQEGVNNACKHAKATNFMVTLDYRDPNKVRLMLCDDGVGASKMDGGFGLLGIEERVNLLGGDLNIETSPGNGFKIEMVVPA